MGGLGTADQKTMSLPRVIGPGLLQRKKPVPEGPCANDGLHRKRLRPFGYRLLNEAGGRQAVCFNV